MKVVEARRYVLLSDTPLDTTLPEARSWLTGPGEYTVPRRSWSAAIQRLCRVTRPETLAIEAARLGTLNFRSLATSFRRLRVPDDWTKAHVLYLSPNLRRWRQVPRSSSAMELRLGWCVLVKEGHKNRYFVPDRGPVTGWSAGAQASIVRGYESAVGDLAMPLAVADAIAIVPRSRVVLPPTYSEWLRRMCVVPATPESIWLWDENDLPLIRDVLRKLRIRLEQTADALSGYAFAEFLEALSLAYSRVLSSEDGVSKFSQWIRARDIEAFGEGQLAEVLSRLFSRAYRGDRVATLLLDYLGERMALRADWRSNGPLNGVRLWSGTLTYAGQATSASEHLMGLPDCGSWTTLRTTQVVPVRHETSTAITFTRYRVLPYFGRLRLTPGNELLQGPEDSGDDLWRSLLTLPSLEQHLSPEKHPFAFSISFVPWTSIATAERVLMERVIGTVARVIRRNPAELDLPGLLCEDPSGKRFALETRELPIDMVPAADALVRFVARRADASGGESLPIYELVHPASFRTIDEDDYWSAAATAIVKMHFRASLEFIATLLGEHASDGLRGATARNWLAASNGGVFFRYPGVNEADCRALWHNREPASATARTLDRLKPRLHPLYAWTFDPGPAPSARTLWATGTPEEVHQAMGRALDASGSVFVSALGRDRVTLILAIRRLSAARDRLRFERHEDLVRRGTADILRTQYRVFATGAAAR